MTKLFKSEEMRNGYNDAKLGQDFIKVDQSLAYYEGTETRAYEIYFASISATKNQTDRTRKVNVIDEGNPNHPMYEMKLFGYEQKEFLAKQYK